MTGDVSLGQESDETAHHEAEDRMLLAQELKFASDVVEKAGFRAAGLMDTGTVTKLILMAHTLEELSERVIRDLPDRPPVS